MVANDAFGAFRSSIEKLCNKKWCNKALKERIDVQQQRNPINLPY